MRNKVLSPSLKAHPVYKAHRATRLAQLVVETPDCMFEECTDCCYLERVSNASVRVFFGLCPECGGVLHTGIIVNGEVHA